MKNLWLKFVKFLADCPLASVEDKEIIYNYYKLDNRLDGLGFILFPEKNELDYLFEVTNVATDNKTGASCPVGLRLRFDLIKEKPLKDKEFYLQSAKEIKERGLFGITPDKMKLITWKEFCEKGYNTQALIFKKDGIKKIE